MSYTDAQAALLKRLYYDQRMMFGRDKLWSIAQSFANPPTRRAVQAWLRTQETYQLHLKPKRTTTIKPVLMNKPGIAFQMDLTDMGKYADGPYRYILALIDAFSRKAYVQPLKDKEAVTVAAAFKSLYRDNYLRKMRLLQTDNGSEFIASEMQTFLNRRHVKHIRGIAGRPQSQGIVERFNGTLKSLIYENMLVTKSKRWVNDLDLIMRAYNSTMHDTIKTTPNEANNDDEQRAAVTARIRQTAKVSGRADPDDIQVGDRVRRKVFKGKLEKGSTINWSRTFYKVISVIHSKKPYVRIRYRLEGADGTVPQSFTRNDVQLVKSVQSPPKPRDFDAKDDPTPPAGPTPPPPPAVGAVKSQPTVVPSDRVLRARAPRQEPQPKPKRTKKTPEAKEAEKTEEERKQNQRLAERLAGKLAMKPNGGYKFKPL